ncbi:MAG TPA: hypothetical protein VFJ82_12385 [Longimicrobium sp.]|nr:hypothetical protein [Longimicrobium sp.]
MRTIRHAARLAAAVLALSLAGVAAAPAQSAVTSTQRSGIRAPNPPAVDRALREFGFDPYRLRPDQQRALDSAWGLLFPEANRYRATLNSSQATALVYVALVHGRDRRGGYGRGGFGDDYGRGGYDQGGNGRGGYGRDDDDDRDDDGYDRGGQDGRSGRGGAQCVDVNRRVYDVENAFTSDNRSLFVTDAQKRSIRESAREVQRLAVDRGWRRVSDRAGEVIASVSENMPERDEVRGRIQALKNAVDESCGRDGGRRY